MLLLCGCKGYRETDSEYIISAIGFEAAGGGFEVYAEVLDIETGGNYAESDVFKCRGETPYEAVDNLVNLLSKMAVFDHCGIAVIADNVRGTDFKAVIDYLYNIRNLNLGVYMYKTASVKELFNCRAQGSCVGYDVMAIEESVQKTSGVSFKNKYYEMLARLYKNGGFCLPRIGVNDNSPAITGQTVFLELEPALNLSEQEATVFNILFSGSSGGEISVAGKRFIVNGISSDLKPENGGLLIEVCCQPRFDDDLCRDLEAEAKNLLEKISGANAASVLGGGDVKNIKVSVYDK